VPKLKTRRSAKKRFKITATGKILRRRAYAGHLFTGKRPKRKRRLSKPALVSKKEMKVVRRLLPYG